MVMPFLKRVKIIAGPGAGVTVRLVDCTVPWDEDKQEFELTKCHALFTAAYKSVNTKTADEGYSDALEIQLHTPEDEEGLELDASGFPDSVTIDEKDDLYEIDSTKGLVLSAGWTRAKFSKGDSFEFSVSKNYIDIGGTATFTEDGEYAWSDLDRIDDDDD